MFVFSDQSEHAFSATHWTFHFRIAAIRTMPNIIKSCCKMCKKQRNIFCHQMSSQQYISLPGNGVPLFGKNFRGQKWPGTGRQCVHVCWEGCLAGL